MVESQPSKLLVAGSIPVSRSILRSRLPRPGELRTAGQTKVEASQFATSADVIGRSASAASAKADVAQLAERVLGKDEVTSSILVIGSSLRSERAQRVSSGRACALSQGSFSVESRSGG